MNRLPRPEIIIPGTDLSRYTGTVVSDARSGIEACARWTFRFSIFWTAVTATLVGLGGLFWGYRYAGSDLHGQGAFYFLLALLLSAWIPPQVALWKVQGTAPGRPVHAVRTALGIILGYLILALSWGILSFYGLTWESIRSIVLLCYVPYFVQLFLWLPWLLCQRDDPGDLASGRKTATGTPSEAATWTAPAKTISEPVPVTDASEGWPPELASSMVDAPIEEYPRQVPSTGQAPFPRESETPQGVDTATEAVVADTKAHAAPTESHQVASKGDPIQAAQAVAGQAYLTSGAILLFDHKPEYDSYTARNLIPSRSSIVVVSSGPRYVRVRTEAGVEAFIEAREQLVPVTEAATEA